jgi:hypothetical protein
VKLGAFPGLVPAEAFPSRKLALDECVGLISATDLNFRVARDSAGKLQERFGGTGTFASILTAVNAATICGALKTSSDSRPVHSRVGNFLVDEGTILPCTGGTVL